MDKQLKRKDLVLVKWNSKYMTDTEISVITLRAFDIHNL